MAIFGQDPVSIGQDGFTSSAGQVHQLGTRGITKDGRIFRYAQAGAADLVAGTVLQQAAPVANHLGAAVTTPSATAGGNLGDKFVTITPTASTAGAANLYAEGFAQVDTTPGNGYTYVVSSHPAIAAAAFILTLAEPLQGVVLTSSSKIGLKHNPWKNVIISPTTVTAGLAGIAHYVITTVQYGWVQTRGMASVLINGTPGPGIGVTQSATTAGAVDVITTTNLVTSQVVGYMAQTGVSTKNNFIYVTID